MSRFLKIIVNLVVLAAILVAAALLVPPFAGVDTVMNDNTETDTNLPIGSVAYGRTVQASTLEKGDRIIYSEGASDYIYEITDMDASAGAYKVKDIYNSNSDEETLTIQKSVPKLVLVVPFIGYAAIALQSIEGLVVIGLGIVFLIILFILSEVWRKDKEEDDEDDDEDDEEDEEEDDEEEDDEEEERLSRRERRRLKKEEKRRRKLERKGLLDDEDEDEDEEEEQVQGEADAPAQEDQEFDEAMKDAMSSIAMGIANVSQPEQVEDATIVMPDPEAVEEALSSPSLGAAEENQESLETAETGYQEETEFQVIAEEAEAEEEPSLASEEESVQTGETQEEFPAGQTQEILPEVTQEISEEIQEEMYVEDQAPAYNPDAVLQAPTVEELLAKAQAAGEAPDVKEDKDNDVTLLDYSKLL